MNFFVPIAPSPPRGSAADAMVTTTIRLRFDRTTTIRPPTSRLYAYLCARAAAPRHK